jgi:LmbE family N-acetylglucosaminyl deacetylase
MSARPAFLENSVVIGAHPDDELLWFNSILRQVDEVIVVFKDFWAQPHIGAARAAAIADYPRVNVTCLNIAESGAYGCADWSDPATNEYGIILGLEANRRALTRLARMSMSKMQVARLDTIAADSVARAYEANFHAIADALRPRLRPDMNVFTHNPWGEYGHEEHVQVFRVLQVLRDEIGFKLWMSNYCTDRAMPLAMRYFVTAPGGYIRLPTDKAFADEVAAVYKKHDCWTWADDWAWFDEECFMEAPHAGSEVVPHRHLFPLNFFTIDAARSRKWLPLALTMSVASAAIGVTISEAV